MCLGNKTLFWIAHQLAISFTRHHSACCAKEGVRSPHLKFVHTNEGSVYSSMPNTPPSITVKNTRLTPKKGYA